MTIGDQRSWTTASAREAVRTLMPVEGDLAFRRRCETIVEFLNAGPGDRILDCGCGYGFVLHVLKELTGAEVVGLDPDETRLEHIRRHDPKLRSVDLVVGDAQFLPFSDCEFTHVVCSEVIEHLEDDGAAVSQLYRVLQPGGVLVITVPSADFPLAWDPPNYLLKRLTGKSLRGRRPWSGIWYGHKRLYKPEQLGQLVASAGFAIEEDRSLTHSCPPFAHLLLYGLLKPLLMRGLLPRRIAGAGNRLRTHETDKVPVAVSLAMRLLEHIDRPNDDLTRIENAGTFVSHAIKARKPF